jgi:hypothetical protein
MSESVNGRLPNGRWQKGYRGGPGRSKKTHEERFATLNTVMTPDRWAEIVETAVKQAIKGDKDARNWLSKYTLGDKITIEHEGVAMNPVTIYLPSNGRDGD